MQYRWTLELEQCPGSGVGGLENNQNEHGAGRHNEDRSEGESVYRIVLEHGRQLGHC